MEETLELKSAPDAATTASKDDRDKPTRAKTANSLIYTVNDVPPWYYSLIMGLQVTTKPSIFEHIDRTQSSLF